MTGIIPISDAQASMIAEALKVLRRLGSFLDRALGTAPEDIVGIFGGNWLRVRRAENMVKNLWAAKERLEARGVKEPKQATLSLALPILEAAADEDRDERVDLWARLLANAMDPQLDSVRASFIDAVKKMDPPDAVFLRYVYENNISCVALGDTSSGGATSAVGEIAKAVGQRPTVTEVSLSNLESLGFYWKHDSNNNRYQTAKLPEFMLACYPEIEK